jgi:hypothetical protein
MARHVSVKRSTARTIVAYGFSLGALLVQVTMPWLQSRHVAGDGSTTNAAYATDGTPQLHRADGADHDQHRCPVCRLLGQSRARMLPAAPPAIAAPPIATLLVTSAAAPRSSTHRNDASPRAPPRLA